MTGGTGFRDTGAIVDGIGRCRGIGGIVAWEAVGAVIVVAADTAVSQ